MAKQTVLELVQDILNDIDGDEVNSINDTVEAMQVAQTIKSVFNSMIDTRNWPHLKKLKRIDAVSDLDTPTHMKLPVGVKEVVDLTYDMRKVSDTRSKYNKVIYKDPSVFLDRTNSRNSDNDNIVEVTDIDGATLLIRNDVAPSIFTSFDDEYLVFDSYDIEVDDTLQNSKTQMIAYCDPIPFVLDDAHIADLPSEAFSALLAEAKSTASFNINQTINNKAEQTARRNNTWLARKAFKVGGGLRYNTNFGRHRRSRDTADTLLERSMKANNDSA